MTDEDRASIALGVIPEGSLIISNSFEYVHKGGCVVCLLQIIENSLTLISPSESRPGRAYSNLLRQAQ